MIPYILSAIAIIISTTKFVDDIVLSEKQKNYLIDISDKFWYWLTLQDPGKIFKAVANKKIMYVYIYLSFFIVSIWLFIDSSFETKDIITRITQLVIAFFLRRLIENGIALYFIDTIRNTASDFSKRHLIRFGVFILVFFLIIYLLVYLSTSFQISNSIVWFFRDLFLITLYAEFIYLALLFLFFLVIIILVFLIIGIFKVTEYVMRRICESNRSFVYLISFLLAILSALLAIFSN